MTVEFGYEVRDFIAFGCTEPEEEVIFTVDADEEGNLNQIRIHPWIRNQPEVYVSVGWVTPTGETLNRDEASDYYECTIVDRKEFVDGLRAVFPELRSNGAAQ